MIEKGHDCVSAWVDRRSCGAVVGKRDILSEGAWVCYDCWGFFRAIVGEAQVAQLDGGITLGGGRRGETLLLPNARPALDLNRGGSDLLSCEVGRDEETGVVVSVNQLDVVDRPSAFLAVLGKFELHLVGSIGAVAADTVGHEKSSIQKFLTTRASEGEGRKVRIFSILYTTQIVCDREICGY